MKRKLLNYIHLMVVPLLVIGGLLVVWQLTDKYLGYKQQELRLRAFETCAQSASYTRKVVDGTVTTPVDDVYKQCLKDKGIQ